MKAWGRGRSLDGKVFQGKLLLTREIDYVEVDVRIRGKSKEM
jgi:hypothetical protein